MLAFALYGLSKLVFNLVAIRLVSPATLGAINTLLAVHTLIAVGLTQPIGSVVNRFIPEFVALGRSDWAGALFHRSVIAVVSVASVGVAVFLGLWRIGWLPANLHESLFLTLLFYLPGYSLYSFFKMAYYGFERVASYTIAETTAGLAFFAALAAAAVHPTALTMALPWVVHPVVFSLVAVFHFRPIGSGGSQFPARPYLTYGLSWLASSAAGIAAYHLGIVATGVGLDDPQQVAYYSVSLSLLSPLTFFPITLSMVLFPRMAAHAAVAGDRSNAELLRISTLALLVGVLATGCVITALTPEILRWSNLPESKSMCAVLQILFFGIGLSLIATPAGSYLSATHYARLSAAIGLSSLMMGLLFWLTFIPSLGLVGSALGYAVLTTARAVGTLLASHHYGKWLPRLALRHLFAALLPVGMVLSVQADYSVGVRAVATAGAWLLLGLLLFPEIAAVVHRAIGSRLLRRESLNV